MEEKRVFNPSFIGAHIDVIWYMLFSSYEIGPYSLLNHWPLGDAAVILN